jgi:hypothetical protein
MATNINSNINKISVPINDNVDSRAYFNNYFLKTVNISPNVDAAILTYFEAVADTKDAAKALATAVIYTSQTQGVDPMQTLKEFSKLPAGDLNAYLTMFLNLQRKGTSYLGISNQPLGNKYIDRCIMS